MTDFHGVFPYLVSPIDASGRIKTDVLGEALRRPDQGRRAWPDAARLDRRVRLSQPRAAPSRGAGDHRGRARARAGYRRRRLDRPPPTRSRRRSDYQRLGADGILAILEAYFPLKDAQVEAISAPSPTPSIFRSCSTPIRISSAAICTLDVIARLAEHPRIRYIKDASTNTGRLLSIMNRCPDLKVFSASAHIPAAVMLIGGVGWMAGPACIVPRQSVRLYELCQAARWPEAMKLQRELWRINEAFARFNLAACIKAGLQIQGYEVGDPVPPQAPLNDDERRAVEKILGEVEALKTA